MGGARQSGNSASRGQRVQDNGSGAVYQQYLQHSRGNSRRRTRRTSSEAAKKLMNEVTWQAQVAERSSCRSRDESGQWQQLTQPMRYTCMRRSSSCSWATIKLVNGKTAKVIEKSSCENRKETSARGNDGRWNDGRRRDDANVTCSWIRTAVREGDAMTVGSMSVRLSVKNSCNLCAPICLSVHSSVSLRVKELSRSKVKAKWILVILHRRLAQAG